jgi:predicted nucleic-acid-binding protein
LDFATSKVSPSPVAQSIKSLCDGERFYDGSGSRQYRNSPLKMKSDKLIGVDTSFVLRLLVGEPKAQAKSAVVELNRLSAEGKQIAVSDLVVAETYFALQHHYKVPKKEALDTLKKFLNAPEVKSLGAASVVLAEPNLSRANPGFVDRLIHANYLSLTAGMLSFEKAAKKLSRTKVPSNAI